MNYVIMREIVRQVFINEYRQRLIRVLCVWIGVGQSSFWLARVIVPSSPGLLICLSLNWSKAMVGSSPCLTNRRPTSTGQEVGRGCFGMRMVRRGGYYRLVKANAGK